MGDRIRTTKEQIVLALKRAATEPEGPTAVDVRYLPTSQILVITLESGRRVAFAREEVQELASASARKIAEVVIEDFGSALHWPSLDLDLSVEGLLKGITGNARWMKHLQWQRQQGKSSEQAYAKLRA